MAIENILLIRTGGLGDSLMLWPGVAGIRQRFPAGRLDLMGHPDRLGLLAVEGGANRALDVEGSGLHHLFEMGAELPDGVRQRFGAYSTVVAFAAPGDFALAENLSVCGAGEVHAFLPFPPEGSDTHVADHVRDALVGVNLALEGTRPLLPVPAAERQASRDLLEAVDLDLERLALIAPGSGSSAKNWSAARFAGLLNELDSLGLEPALIQGPADRSAVEAVQERLVEPLPVLADANPSALRGLLAQAVLYVGNDSGPTHLAALTGTSTVAVFGAGDVDRWRPLGPRVEVVQDELTGLTGVTVKQVLAACRRLTG